jgi:hypothetical protein
VETRSDSARLMSTKLIDEARSRELRFQLARGDRGTVGSDLRREGAREPSRPDSIDPPSLSRAELGGPPRARRR